MESLSVIRLVSRERSDGSVHVSSPDIPVFQVVGRDQKTAARLAIKLLREYLQRNTGRPIKLSIPEDIRVLIERKKKKPLQRHDIPPQVVASLAA